MAIIRKARIFATLAVMTAALSVPAGPSIAAGPAISGQTGVGAIVEPMVLAARMAVSARHRLAAWIAEPASLSGIVIPMPEQTLAAMTSDAATGSIRRPDSLPDTRTSARARTDLLASVALPFRKLPALRRMEPVYASMEKGIFADCRTAACENARATLETVVASRRDGDLFALTSAVNRSVNRLVSYRRDRDTHGAVDYWASPSQTLNAGVGDCEDYAILKMAVLESAGVPSESMSLVVLRDQRRAVYHAVLAVSTDRGSYILDNLDQSVRLDSELADYMPLYSISAGRGFIHGRRSGSVQSASATYDMVAPGEGMEEGPFATSTELRGRF